MKIFSIHPWRVIALKKYFENTGHYLLCVLRGFYKYIWSHDENGGPGRIFHYDKIHSKHWHWYAPVHEMLTADEPYVSRYNSHAIDLFDDIFFSYVFCSCIAFLMLFIGTVQNSVI